MGITDFLYDVLSSVSFVQEVHAEAPADEAEDESGAESTEEEEEKEEAGDEEAEEEEEEEEEPVDPKPQLEEGMYLSGSAGSDQVELAQEPRSKMLTERL